jgi:long-chain acyl-CoA synthetase
VHLGKLATEHPDKPAVIMGGTGAVTTYAELDGESRRLARLLYERGLRPGDTIAVLLENGPRFLAATWAAQRSGLRYVPVNWHLTVAEAGYVVADSGAQALITSAALADTATAVAAGTDVLTIKLMDGAPAPGFESYPDAVESTSDQPVPDELEGAAMFYSSGTTGRPKGIKPALTGNPFGTSGRLDQLLSTLYGFGADTTYLSPGPLYHAAPLGYSMATIKLGGTVVVMERFDAEQTLALVERHRVSAAQFVPTMFVRMLKLPDQTRTKYDLSSLRTAVHAAAPCPVPVKHEMIDWLGPILYEYYAGSEGNGFIVIDSPGWLARPGTVGVPAYGAVHITDDTGAELPPGEVGMIWLESESTFSYHNDPVKTAAAYNDKGWSTLGDLGHVDADGYLFLSDRRTDLIISGGVNVYPAEVEQALIVHPAVRDVAVVGIPDDDLGQRVAAVVQVEPPAQASPELAAALLDWCRDRLARVKCPVRVDFDPDLPRLPSGKLLRRQVRQRYDAG